MPSFVDTLLAAVVFSKTPTRTRKDASDSPSLKLIHDPYNAGVGSSGKEEQSDKNDDDVGSCHKVPPQTVVLNKRKFAISPAHPEVGDAPKDEAEEAVKQRGHQGEEAAEEGDDLGDDEGEDPCCHWGHVSKTQICSIWPSCAYAESLSVSPIR